MSGLGSVGDRFMSAIETLSARIPYMVSPGNHEFNGGNFKQYIERFAAVKWGVGQTGAELKSPGLENLFYSYDHGLVHFVAIDTECWLEPNVTCADAQAGRC